jgi:hypothetical protein
MAEAAGDLMTKKKDKTTGAITKTEPASSALAQAEKHPFQRRDEPPTSALMDVRPKSIQEGSRLATVFAKVARHQGLSEERLFEDMLELYIKQRTDLEAVFSNEDEGGFGKG